jgi:hypothetical protein
MADITPLDPRRDLAAYEDAGSRPGLFPLWIGGMQPVTDSAPSAVNDIKQYQVLALLDNNTVTPFVPGTHEAKRIVISAQPVVTAGQMVPYWNAGRFNHEALVWPAGTALDTYAERKALLIGCDVQVGHTI